MKLRFIYSYIMLALAVVSLQSCLKERVSNLTAGSDNTLNLVEFKNTGANTAGAQSLYPKYATDLGVLKTGDIRYIHINVSYSGVNVAPSDITVNITADQASLDRYNDDNGTDYMLPPISVASFPSGITIKKGQKVATDSIKITIANDFDFSVNYAVPLKIVSTVPTTTISGNFGAAMYSFGVRNVWDGVYTVTALAPMVDGFSPALTGLYPLENMALITTTGNSVSLYDGQYFGNNYYHPIASGADISAYGSFSPQFFFNGSTVTNVQNYYGQPASGATARSGAIVTAPSLNTVVYNVDGTVNYFDVKYQMLQVGEVRTTFTERFTRTGARD